MIWKPAALILCTLSPMAVANLVRSGKAAAEWISSSTTCDPGTALRTAVRLVIDPGWHTYWENPGDAGMKPSIEWNLPPGWSVGPLGFPLPERFDTGGLAGFGYQGTVEFPVTVDAPREFTGEITLKGRFVWLTCNDTGCVPGEAEISLTVKCGTPSPTADAPAIHAAELKVPRPDGAARLSVSEKPDTLLLSLNTPVDLSRLEAFPATPEAIDPAAVIRFAKQADTWISEVPKSQYLHAPLKALTLVFSGKADGRPFSIMWKTAD